MWFYKVGKQSHFTTILRPPRVTNNKNKLWKSCKANKFSKSAIVIRFNLLRVCPFVPSFVFALQENMCCVIYTFFYIYGFSSYFNVSLNLVAVLVVSVSINFLTHLWSFKSYFFWIFFFLNFDLEKWLHKLYVTSSAGNSGHTWGRER